MHGSSSFFLMRAAAPVALLVALAGCAGTGTNTPPAAAARGGAATSPPAETNAGASRTPAPEQTRDILARFASDRATLERLVGARYPQLTGRKRELMVDQVAAMFASPAFAARLHEVLAGDSRVAAAGPLGLQVAYQQALRDRAAALGSELTLRGMARLPLADQERFVKVAIGLHRSVDAATCRAMIDGKLSPSRLNEIEASYGASRPEAEFEQNLAMSRRAMEAELADQPPQPVHTPAQLEAAKKAWGRAILARQSASPAAKQRFERYQADPDKASDADACWAAVQYLQAMLDIRGPERTWQLQSFMIEAANG